MDRPVTNHSNVGFRHAEKSGDIRASLLVVECHHHDRAFPFFQRLQATRELFMIEVRHG